MITSCEGKNRNRKVTCDGRQKGGSNTLRFYLTFLFSDKVMEGKHAGPNESIHAAYDPKLTRQITPTVLEFFVDHKFSVQMRYHFF